MDEIDDDRRRVLLAAAGGIGTVAGTSGSAAGGAASAATPTVDRGWGVTLIDAAPERGFHYPYFLYARGPWNGEERPLLVQPNNTGTSSDDFAVHRQAAREDVTGGFARSLADDLAIPLFIPVFPRHRPGSHDTRHYVHQLDAGTMAIDDGPLERVDLQLRRMIEDARERLAAAGAPITDDVLVNGFSASGNFVNRFAALHPDLVRSVTAGGINGLAILPIEHAKGHPLYYQLGVADVAALTGEPFDRDAFADVAQFLYMGAEDDNDALPNHDIWSPDQREIAREVYGEDIHDERFPYCESVYDEVGADATFRLYEGASHEVTPEIREDVRAFHREHVDWTPARTANRERNLLDRLEATSGVDWLTEAMFAGSAGTLALGGGYLYRRRSRAEGTDDD